MKFEEKRKKNKNCELSHMVRPAKSLEVYKQKQNTLFISECVEHRMFKVTWARLCVFGRLRGRVHVSKRMHGRAGGRVLLGRGGKNHGLNPGLDRRENVSTRAIFRNKVELATLDTFR